MSPVIRRNAAVRGILTKNYDIMGMIPFIDTMVSYLLTGGE